MAGADLQGIRVSRFRGSEVQGLGFSDFRALGF